MIIRFNNITNYNPLFSLFNIKIYRRYNAKCKGQKSKPKSKFKNILFSGFGL